jgi:hypothetical protein
MEITGALQRNDLDKWEIVDDEGRVRELSSGSACDVLIGGHWIATRIEFGHGSRPTRIARFAPPSAWRWLTSSRVWRTESTMPSPATRSARHSGADRTCGNC